jgi:mono/diheme cytochrome c family protein
MLLQRVTGCATLVVLMLQVCAAMAASAEHGKAVFMKAGCWQCHGTAGQGGGAGPRIAPDPLPYDTLAAFVRTSSRAMPPYREKILSDADLAEIYAYLQSIPQPADAATIPLLRP